MTDYGHPLDFGLFATPTSRTPHTAVELAMVADREGLDLITFQDHPHLPGFLDTWTLMSYAAARTRNVRLAGADRVGVRARQRAPRPARQS